MRTAGPAFFHAVYTGRTWKLYSQSQTPSARGGVRFLLVFQRLNGCRRIKDPAKAIGLAPALVEQLRGPERPPPRPSDGVRRLLIARRIEERPRVMEMTRIFSPSGRLRLISSARSIPSATMDRSYGVSAVSIMCEIAGNIVELGPGRYPHVPAHGNAGHGGAESTWLRCHLWRAQSLPASFALPCAPCSRLLFSHYFWELL